MDKRQIAALVRRMPWIGGLAIFVSRRFQPWVTVGVVGAVFDDAGRVLVVEHVFHPKYPWGLSGGWMNHDEDPDETVRRELLEETGLQVEVIKPLVIKRTPNIHRHLDMSYLCRLAPDSGDIQLCSELLDYRWADPSDLPLLSPYHRRVIQAALAERAQVLEKSGKGV